MNGRKLFYLLLGFVLVGVGFTIAGDGIKPTYRPSEKAFYLTDTQASFVRPGLNVEIQKVDIAAPNVTVTFRLTDDQGQGLDRLGIDTPGAVALSFIIARIKPGDTQYTNYNTTIKVSTINGSSAVQAAADSGGTYTSMGNGVYQYTMGLKLPSNFEVNSTHTVGITADRDLTPFGLKLYLKNALINFVPSGAPVTQVREVVSTAACNQCHDPLGLITVGTGRRWDCASFVITRQTRTRILGTPWTSRCLSTSSTWAQICPA